VKLYTQLLGVEHSKPLTMIVKATMASIVHEMLHIWIFYKRIFRGLFSKGYSEELDKDRS